MTNVETCPDCQRRMVSPVSAFYRALSSEHRKEFCSSRYGRRCLALTIARLRAELAAAKSGAVVDVCNSLLNHALPMLGFRVVNEDIIKLYRDTVWILVYPAPDVVEQWVAHCLDLDVVTQGNSMEHAIHMGREAVDLVVRADLDAGLDPFEREQAPDEDWEPFFHLMKHAVPLRRIPLEHWGQIRLLASSYDVLLPVADEAATEANCAVPDAWMLSRVQEQRDSGSFLPHP